MDLDHYVNYLTNKKHGYMADVLFADVMEFVRECRSEGVQYDVDMVQEEMKGLVASHSHIIEVAEHTSGLIDKMTHEIKSGRSFGRTLYDTRDSMEYHTGFEGELFEALVYTSNLPAHNQFSMPVALQLRTQLICAGHTYTLACVINPFEGKLIISEGVGGLNHDSTIPRENYNSFTQFDGEFPERDNCVASEMEYHAIQRLYQDVKL